MTVHYVEFIYGGIIVAETSAKVVGHRNPDKITLAERSYGFRFFDQEEVKKDGEILKGKPKNLSKWYMTGRVMSLADVKRELPDQHIMISNMENNKISHVLATQYGGHVPYDPKEIEIRPIKGAKA